MFISLKPEIQAAINRRNHRGKIKKMNDKKRHSGTSPQENADSIVRYLGPSRLQREMILAAKEQSSLFTYLFSNGKHCFIVGDLFIGLAEEATADQYLPSEVQADAESRMRYALQEYFIDVYRYGAVRPETVKLMFEASVPPESSAPNK